MVRLTASAIDQLKLLPRLAFLCQIILTWKVCLWFMTLPDPNNSTERHLFRWSLQCSVHRLHCG